MINFRDAFDLADAALDVSNAASDDEISSFLSDAVAPSGTPAGSGFELFNSRMLAHPKATTFDPSVIIAILSAVLPMILNCFKPTPTPTPAQTQAAVGAVRNRFVRSRLAGKIYAAVNAA